MARLLRKKKDRPSTNDIDHVEDPNEQERLETIGVQTDPDDSFSVLIQAHVEARDKVYEELCKQSGCKVDASAATTVGDDESNDKGDESIDAVNKMTLKRFDATIEALKDQDDRLRKDYELFRDVHREENVLVRDRLASFGTLQGFLWAALALSLNRGTGNDVQIFVYVLSGVGIAVSFFTILRLREGQTAKDHVTNDWHEHLKKHTNNPYAAYNTVGPGIAGRPYTSRHVVMKKLFYLEPVPVSFFCAWFAILGLTIGGVLEFQDPMKNTNTPTMAPV